MTKPNRLFTGIILPALIFFQCGPVKSLYIKKGYDPNAADAVKNIRVVAGTYEADPALTGLLLAIAGDHMKIRKYYHVREIRIAAENPGKDCSGVDGVVFFTVLKSGLNGDEGELSLRGELSRCPTMEKLWYADGTSADYSGVEDITTLVKIYRREFGETARIYGAAAFNLLKEIIDTMPEPPSPRGVRKKVF